VATPDPAEDPVAVKFAAPTPVTVADPEADPLEGAATPVTVADPAEDPTAMKLAAPTPVTVADPEADPVPVKFD
jgi:hypothetical protein